VIPDRIKGVGALGGLYTALVEAPTELVLVIACDMPFLTAPFLTRLVTLAAGVDAAVPHDAAGRHPLCACYARRAARHLKSRLDAGERRVLDAIHGLDVRDVGVHDLAPFDPDGSLLANVNTPDDYARVRGAAEAGAAADR
jgi:molybdopterin-guanine dinucleotide biosynthesis protein A